MADINNNFINGRWVGSAGGKTYEQKNPADLTEVTGIWQKSTAEDVRAAVEAAHASFAGWSGLSAYTRATYLKKMLCLMKERTRAIARIITAENGKTLKESKSEVAFAIKETEFQISEGIRLSGETLPSSLDGVLAFSVRRPLGPVAVIAPWNFPFNVPCRKVTPALMAGNTCVFKPATLTPDVGAEFVRLFEDAGLPAGVLNFITGSGSEIGSALVNNPLIKAVSFTGSTGVGRQIHAMASANMTRTQLEMGGKNPIVVLADANLEEAADSAVLAAYACAGQWCTSTSRAIVEKSVVNDFLELVLERLRKIVVGNGTEPATTMGPVCGEAQLKSILQSIEKGKSEGAQLLAGGNRITARKLGKGCFIEPTVFADVTPDMFIAQEEIFGPVLSVITVNDFDEAIEIANGVRFGLSSSIYTNELQKALTFLEKTDVGLTHVNIHTAVKEPQFTFGGVKSSGFGIPEGGHSGIEFFTEHKVAYIKYR